MWLYEAASRIIKKMSTQNLEVFRNALPYKKGHFFVMSEKVKRVKGHLQERKVHGGRGNWKKGGEEREINTQTWYHCWDKWQEHHFTFLHSFSVCLLYISLPLSSSQHGFLPVALCDCVKNTSSPLGRGNIRREVDELLITFISGITFNHSG